ncbi:MULTISPECIES: host specificity factor TipJ family phage tail protein [unclassified Tatumella]|uniref:host specificity factor TipJ family phage tail protein n=1 Tax=unclassified Tatumella TaxID=2649542 RepID=UPI001BAF01E7|nr:MULTISPECIES: host specificity factor TipJ family phage tail protein [unclassified Tatumella]MBS0854936.1 MoaD/ThiS family protein [Tatumella sp. JGM16]MBS0912102.1 MoaD/ThiS family protein [Tatumella sp. JGM91]
MARYELQRLPGSPFERGEISNNARLVDWLNQQNLHSNVVIRMNGRTLEDDFDLNYVPARDDVIGVFDQPEGGVGKVITSVLRPVTKVLSGVMKLFGLSAKTGIPSVSTGESSNNDLTQQTNRARLYKGRPNIYGQVRAYPDLIQESIFEYIDNKKYVTEWMEVGYGYYDISSVRYSESSLTALAGASYQIYNPGDVIGDMAQGYSFDDVDGQELPGLNEDDSEIKQQGTTDTLLEGTFSGGQFYARINKETGFDSLYDSAKPVYVTVIVNVTYNTASGSVTKDVSVQGTLFQSTITDDGALINPDQYYNFWFSNLSGSDYLSLPSDTTVNLTKLVVTEYVGTTIGPFFAALESQQLWIHLYANLGGGYDAPAKITWWQVDDDNNQIAGTQESMDVPVHNSGSDQDYIYVTEKITPTAGVGRYAFSLYRTNNSQSDSVLYISAAHAVTMRTNVVYPDDTLVKVTVQQTETPTTTQDRKYNCLAERMVISWTTSGGIDYTLRPSRSFADAVLHEWVVTGNQDASRLDIATLYEIFNSLSDPQLGYFDYTFSDAAQPLGERLQTICDVARVSMNWIGDTLTFWRDEAVAYPETVFSRSNMFWDDYKVAYTMSLPGGFDGVTLDYTDPTSNKKTYIYLQIDDSGITEVGDATNNANQISLAGSRNKTQAYDRAYLEARKILYSRLTMTVKVLEQTQVVRGKVVQCPDMYDNAQQTGYLKGRNGDTFYTSERIDFSADQLFVVMTDSDGAFRGRWQCLPVEENPKAFSASADQFVLNIYDGRYIQSPSRYFIASDSDLNATLWRVDSAKPNGDDTQTLTLTEYSPDIYQN